MKLLVASLLILLVSVGSVEPSAASPAQNCQTSGTYDRQKDGANVEAGRNCPSGGESSPASSGGGEVDYRALWNKYCAHILVYKEGYTVSLISSIVLTEEQLAYERNIVGGTHSKWGLDGTSYSKATIGCNSGVDPFTTEWMGPTGELPAVAVDPIVLRDRAAARIVVPEPSVGSNPPFNEPGRFGVVQMPVWFWLNDPWETLGPEVESEGGVTVEVVAYPTVATWTTGDGGEVTCDGPGMVWQAGLSEGATDCSYTYTSSSADEPGASYSLSAAVSWEFEWWINGVSQGTFGDVTMTTPFTYQVGEIQAIET
jgi:hypothetical protein